MTETLTYRKRVRKGIDHIANGVLYLHYFGTGWQELVFADDDVARRFADARNIEFRR